MRYIDKYLSNYTFVPTGVSAFDRFMGGIHLGTYYVIAAPPKAGKTTFVDAVFILPFLFKTVKTDKNIRIILFNLEMSYENRITNWAVAYVNNRLETHFTTVDLIRLYKLYKDGGAITEYHIHFLERVDQTLKWIEDKIVEGRIKIIQNADIVQFIDICKSEFEKNKDVHYIVVIDHIRRIAVPYVDSNKLRVDAVSSEIVNLRNEYSNTFVAIVHTNRKFSYRTLPKNSVPVPLPEDIKDTGNLSEDADYIFTYSNPRFLEMYRPNSMIMGIPMSMFPDTARVLALIESRHTDSPKYTAVKVNRYTYNIETFEIGNNHVNDSDETNSISQAYSSNGAMKNIEYGE